MSKLLLKTWRDITSRKGQFAALVALVALGIACFVAFISAYRNLEASAAFANQELKLADFSVSVIGAPPETIDAVRSLPGVAAAEGRLIVDTGLELPGGGQATVRVVGLPAERRLTVNSLLLDEGAYLDAGAPERGLLHTRLAQDAGLGPGDRLTIYTQGRPRQIAVGGVVTSPEYYYAIRAKGEITLPREFTVLFLGQGEVERLFGRPRSYNDISVLLTPGADREAAIAQVERLLEPYQVVKTVRQEDQPSNFSVQEEIRQNRSFAVFMPVLILVISAASLFIALSRLVQSQRGEIGLAKALGYRDGQILLHYLLFSLLIALSGSLLGIALGQLLAWRIGLIYTDLVGIPFLESRFYPGAIGGAILLSALVCVLAGLLPALASARLAPARAMRADPNISLAGGKLPLLERALGRLLPSSFLFKIPFRNIFRARKRSVYTVTGIVFALILTVTSWSLIDSIDYLIDYQFNQAERWDVTAAFEEPFGASRIGEVAGWPGVERAQAALHIPSRLEAGGRLHEGMITALEPGASFHGFEIVEGPGAAAALEGPSLILPQVLADKLEAKVGDTVWVRTPHSDPLPLTLTAVSRELVGSPIFVGAATGRELAPGPEPRFNSLYLDVESERAQAIKGRLFALPGASQVIVKETLVDKVRELLGFVNVFSLFFLSFAFAIAFVVIYNTFTANVLERSREIATMRTIGESRSRLAAIITLENLLLALAGIPLGLVLGLLTAGYLFRLLSSEAFTITAVIYPRSYPVIVASTLAVLLLSEAPPIRRVFKLDLAQATKFFE